MTRNLVLRAAAVAALTLATSAGAAVVVSNPLAGGDNSAWRPLGEPDTTTYGQTFRTQDGVNVVMNSFSFFVKSQTPATSHLKGYLSEWSGSGITGPLLYTSAAVTGHYADFTELVFSTGGVTLDASKTYVAFMSAAGLFDGIEDPLLVGTHNFSDGYALGGFAYDNGAGAFPGGNWNGCQGTCSDLAFNFAFGEAGNAVPVPATLALAGLGLVAAALARRRGKAA